MNDLTGGHPTKIFVVEDDPIFSRLIGHKLKEQFPCDLQIFTSGGEMLQHMDSAPDIVTIDWSLPDMDGLEVLERVKQSRPSTVCVILSGQENVEVVVQAYKQGAAAYIVKNQSAIIELVKTLSNFNEQVQLRKEVETLREKITDRTRYKALIGESKPMLKVMNMLQRVEKTNMMVLITGESGTGKEVVAGILHNNSPRARKPFVAVNMGAIPADLAESELFGHEKGAFTGADSRRIGKFEEADGGTIFLDEIGELDMQLQTRLLRVLQNRTITRVGGNKEIQLDIRVVAATNRDLLKMSKEGTFREDLYYRLQGFHIHMPPLRDRGKDVVLIARYFLDEFCKINRLGKKCFSSATEKALIEYKWPGNIRELKTIVNRAAIMSDHEEIGPDDLFFQ